MSTASCWDEYSLSKFIKTLADVPSPNHFKSIHSSIIKLGFSRFAVVMTGLIGLALKCGALHDADKLFDDMPQKDVVAWTSMIVGHARHGRCEDSISFFRRLLASGTAPNWYSFSGALSACSGLGVEALGYGKQIHVQVLKSSFLGPVDPIVHHGLLDMYSKCHCLVYVQRLFDSMAVKSLVAWNLMMSAYLRCGQAEEALKLFNSMVAHGVKPGDFTYAICVDACAAHASIKQGTQLHASILKSGFDHDLVIRNSMVDMYSKCGCIGSAKAVFEAMPSRDPVLWTTMISAYGRCGCVSDAIEMFEKMIQMNIKRDEVAYLAVLSACSHAGLLSKGWQYFQLMFEEEHTVVAESEHYGCMVDLLCRSGRSEEALDFIEHMPFEANVAIWSTLLHSCRMYGNAKLGQFAASQMSRIDPEFHSNWVLLSSIHAAESEWDTTWKIRESMKDENVKKDPGFSWIELSQ
ncbi:pentatricopeptide repeat-containing protein [Canna indica]|uniref:Pentatricopeptide repeat-containing protein n=1 Tax=Canna indica TaxID=4628 RepID=A0AAQ3QPM6_9LILI|nr:pentatricopeptide repeat-containing protein [Canna indica]